MNPALLRARLARLVQWSAASPLMRQRYRSEIIALRIQLDGERHRVARAPVSMVQRICKAHASATNAREL